MCVCGGVGVGVRDRAGMVRYQVVLYQAFKPSLLMDEMNSLKSLGIQSYAVSCYLGFLGGGLGEGDLLEYLPPPGGDLKEYIQLMPTVSICN